MSIKPQLHQPLDIVVAGELAVPADLDVGALGADVWAANAPAALLLTRHGLPHQLLEAPANEDLHRIQDGLRSLFEQEGMEADALGRVGMAHAIWRTQPWEWRYLALRTQVDAGRTLQLVMCAPRTLARNWLLLAEQLDIPIRAGT